MILVDALALFCIFFPIEIFTCSNLSLNIIFYQQPYFTFCLSEHYYALFLKTKQ